MLGVSFETGLVPTSAPTSNLGNNYFILQICQIKIKSLHYWPQWLHRIGDKPSMMIEHQLTETAIRVPVICFPLLWRVFQPATPQLPVYGLVPIPGGVQHLLQVLPRLWLVHREWHLAQGVQQGWDLVLKTETAMYRTVPKPLSEQLGSKLWGTLDKMAFYESEVGFSTKVGRRIQWSSIWRWFRLHSESIS